MIIAFYISRDFKISPGKSYISTNYFGINQTKCGNLPGSTREYYNFSLLFAKQTLYHPKQTLLDFCTKSENISNKTFVLNRKEK